MGADPSIIGSSLALDEKPCAVLGVMPAGFSFYPGQTQAWILLGSDFQPDRDRMLVVFQEGNDIVAAGKKAIDDRS